MYMLDKSSKVYSEDSKIDEQDVESYINQTEKNINFKCNNCNYYTIICCQLNVHIETLHTCVGVYIII